VRTAAAAAIHDRAPPDRRLDGRRGGRDGELSTAMAERVVFPLLSALAWLVPPALLILHAI